MPSQAEELAREQVLARDEAARELARLLGRARRKLMVRRALEFSAAILPWSAAAVALLVATQALLGPRSPLSLPATSLALLAALACLLPLLVAALHGALSGRLPDLSLALLVDRGLDLDERATAAVALRGARNTDDWSRRALDAIGTRDVSSALPLRPLPWRAAALALAALAGAFFLPAWPQAEVASDGPKDIVVVEAAEKLEEEAEEVAKDLDERGASEEAQRVLEDIKKAAQRAQLEPLSREEAIADLQRLEQHARREAEERKAADAGALERALSSLEQASMKRDASRQAGDEEARSLEKQMEALAEELSKGTSFEDRDRKRMAARLRDAADALSASHPDLAEKLEALADAIERGDMAEAERLASELAKSAELQQLSSEAATDQALSEAQRMVRQAMASLGKAPTDAELAEARAAEEGEGGEGEGRPGDAPRAGFQRSGQASVQTDWGVGTTNEAATEFRSPSRGQQASRQAGETSDWREAYEALHDSTALDGAPGRNTRVRGAIGEGELIAVETRQVSQAPEGATLPSVSVPPSYARANEDALAREEIPAAYREGVRKYFTSLDAPTRAPAKPPAETP